MLLLLPAEPEPSLDEPRRPADPELFCFVGGSLAASPCPDKALSLFFCSWIFLFIVLIMLLDGSLFKFESLGDMPPELASLFALALLKMALSFSFSAYFFLDSSAFLSYLNCSACLLISSVS